MRTKLPRAMRQCAQRARGVTLIELLTVIVVIAILSSIAVGSYRRYMLRSNRTDATTALLRIQVAEEKFFLQNNTYTSSFGPEGLNFVNTAATTSFTTPNSYYTVTIGADPNSTNSLATSYLATATPRNGQTQDTSCPTLTINDQGVRGPTPTATTCWR